jgi:hypothetical protein
MMHYRELLKGVNAYNLWRRIKMEDFPPKPYEQEEIKFKKESRLYSELVAAKKPLSKLINDMEYLLLAWNKRVPSDRKKLRFAIKKVPKSVKKWNLARINLWDYYEEISEIFRIFAKTAKPRKGKSIYTSTGASKALHILNPRFFMMWDESIRYGYGCCEDEEGYFNFLFRSQKEIKEMIRTYNRDYPMTHNISKRIYEGPPVSVLKLLDEYNIAKYTEEFI